MRRGLLSLVAVAAVVALAWFVFNRQGGVVDANSTLYIRLTVPLPEVETGSFFPFGPSRPTLRETVARLRQAQGDDRITAVVIEPRVSAGMWGQLQELRAAVADLRAAGKPVVAYLESGGVGDYYLASAASRVLLMPGGQLDVTGTATYELFFRGALDKLGVTPDLLHIGDYKTYANTFTEKAMTPAHREMATALNRDAYDELVRAIAEGRRRTSDEVRAALDRGPFLGAEAVDAGLVDALAYDDQLDDTAPVAGTRRLDASAYRLRADAPFRAPRIAVLYATGEITSGASAIDTMGEYTLGSDTLVTWIRTARADTDVRAIVLRIDSPGGSAVASEIIWRELMLTRAIKPVVVSMGDVAASGGYYIAVPATRIVAEPGTLTGSIGVVTGKFAVGGALEKLGITTDAVTDGAMAGLNSPFQPFSEAERARVAAQMRETYRQFVGRVAESRGLSPDAVDAIAQGRVWSGRQAQARGLVDVLGGLSDAIREARALAKIPASTAVRLTLYPEHRSLLDILTASGDLSARLGLLVKPATAVVPVAAATGALQRLTRYRPGEMLTLMPNVFVR